MKKVSIIFLMLCLTVILMASTAKAESQVSYDVKEVLYNTNGYLEVKGSFINNSDKPKVAKKMLLIVNGQDSPTSAFVELVRTNINSAEMTQKLINPGQPMEMTFTFPKAKKIGNILEFSYSATITPDTPISIVVDGRNLEMETLPVVENNRTLVPLRAIFEAMGAQISWDDKTQTVTSKKGTKEVKLTIGKTEVYKNGQKIKLDVPAKTVNSRTYVPVRFVGEAFGGKVDWDEVNKRITITNPAQ